MWDIQKRLEAWQEPPLDSGFKLLQSEILLIFEVLKPVTSRETTEGASTEVNDGCSRVINVSFKVTCT